MEFGLSGATQLASKSQTGSCRSVCDPGLRKLVADRSANRFELPRHAEIARTCLLQVGNQVCDQLTQLLEFGLKSFAYCIPRMPKKQNDMAEYFQPIILAVDRRSRISTSIFTSGRSHQYLWSSNCISRSSLCSYIARRTLFIIMYLTELTVCVCPSKKRRICIQSYC